ncbi:hypothetical protein [Actinomadura luteofluorescens]
MLGEQGQLSLCALGELIEEEPEKPTDITAGEGVRDVFSTPEPHGDRSGVEVPTPGHVAIRP